MSNTISLEEWEAKRGRKKRGTRGSGSGGGGTGPDAEAENKFTMIAKGLFRRVGVSDPPKWEHVAQAFEILWVCPRSGECARRKGRLGQAHTISRPRRS